MELQQLKYFVTTAECLNVSRAAARCLVAQPSLSQQIKQLENYLGVKLFDRLGRGVALTDAGKALLPQARKILADVREAEGSIRLGEDHWHGSLSIGAIPTMAPYLLPRALRQLRRERPDCEVTIREDFTEALVEAIADNQIDCALVSTPIKHKLIELEVLAEEELLVALSAKRTRPARSTITIPDLKVARIITLHEMHCLGRQIEGFCSASRLSPQVVCHAAQLATVFELVALGVGISIVPEMAAAADVGKRCQYARLNQSKPTREIAVAWRAGRSKPTAARRLISIIKQNFSQGLHNLSERKGKAQKR